MALTQDDFTRMTGEERAAWAELKRKVDALPDSAADEIADRMDRGEIVNIPSGARPGGVLGAIVAVARVVDSYTGAPARAALGAVQAGGGPIRAATVFGRQVGADPEMAPTGKQIAAKAGLTEREFLVPFPPPIQAALVAKGVKPKVSPAGAAGFGIDVLADPMNLLPVSAIGRIGVKAAKALAEASKGAARAGAAVADVATGTKAATTATNAAIEAAESIKQSFGRVLRPTRSADADELIDIATRAGIDPGDLPEAVEFGKESFVSRRARTVAEGPMGQPKLEAHRRVVDGLNDALDDRIAKIAGGRAPDPVEAGRIIREGFDRSVERFFDAQDVMHDDVVRAMPGLQLSDNAIEQLASKVAGIEKTAKGLMTRGVTDVARAQGRQLLFAVKAIRETNMSYRQTVEAMRQIGEQSFKAQNVLAKVPPDVKRMRDLYFAMREALEDTVTETFGKDAGARLRAANEKAHAFLSDKAKIAGVIGNQNVADEQVFRSLVLNGDTLRAGALKAILAPEEMAQLKGAFLSSIIRENAAGLASFPGLHKALRDKRSVISALFSPDEVESITELTRLGDAIGLPVMSTSQTSAGLVFSNLPVAIARHAASEAYLQEVIRGARARASAALGGTAAPVTGSPAMQMFRFLEARRPVDLELKALQVASPQTSRGEEPGALERRVRARLNAAKGGQR